MKIVFALAAIAALSACATATPTYLPDGRAGTSINCSGANLSWADCERKAGDLCKERGYDVASATQDGAPFAFGTATARSGQVSAGTVVTRTMLIACK